MAQWPREYHDIKTMMYERKMSQEYLAKQLGIAEQTLNAKLNGRRSFIDKEMAQIAMLLDMDGETASRIFLNL